MFFLTVDSQVVGSSVLLLFEVVFLLNKNKFFYNKVEKFYLPGLLFYLLRRTAILLLQSRVDPHTKKC